MGQIYNAKDNSKDKVPKTRKSKEKRQISINLSALISNLWCEYKVVGKVTEERRAMLMMAMMTVKRERKKWWQFIKTKKWGRFWGVKSLEIFSYKIFIALKKRCPMILELAFKKILKNFH